MRFKAPAVLVPLLIHLCWAATAHAYVPLTVSMRSGGVCPNGTSPTFYTVPADSYLVVTDVSWGNSAAQIWEVPSVGPIVTNWTAPIAYNPTSGAYVIPDTHFTTGLVFRPLSQAKAGSSFGCIRWSGYLVSVAQAISAVGETPALDGNLGIVPTVLPNPAEGKSTVRFTLAREERVTVGIFDVQGCVVRTLFVGRMPAGEHSLAWDGTSNSGVRVADGVYFARLETVKSSHTKKVTRLH